jgi:organic radical activating enzyme
MLSIPYLEIPITHVCNLHCDGCCYYANYNLPALTTADEVRETCATWAPRIKPAMIKILGGEPTTHKQLPEIFLTIRKFFPESHIQIITNGLQLEKAPMLPYLLTTPNSSLSLSLHSYEPSYITKMQKSFNTINGWIEKHGINVISSDNRLVWKRHYKGVGAEMRPFEDGDPKGAWKACPARVCLVLAENKLWKCPQIASLHHVADKFGLHDVPEWKPYLAYEGIPATLSDEDLARRVKTGPESICGMCPVAAEHYEKDIHNIKFDLPGIDRVERDGKLIHVEPEKVPEPAE